MEELLYEIYRKLYTPLPLTKLKADAHHCHQQLVERLDKSERNLVLTLIDRKDAIIGEISLDSFICGFRVAMDLLNALDEYDCKRQQIIDGICSSDAARAEK